MYAELEDRIAREYKEGKIAYEEMLEKLIQIKEREELSDILDKLIIVFPKN